MRMILHQFQWMGRGAAENGVLLCGQGGAHRRISLDFSDEDQDLLSFVQHYPLILASFYSWDSDNTHPLPQDCGSLLLQAFKKSAIYWSTSSDLII